MTGDMENKKENGIWFQTSGFLQLKDAPGAEIHRWL